MTDQTSSTISADDGPSAATPHLLAIIGPTASGKSAIAMRLAARRGGEIVSCDSIQLYRGFDIGSAKPSAIQRQQIPHHLIDTLDWHEDFNAQCFVDLADAAVDDISRRGLYPIICGGTGLYLRAFRFGLVALPKAPPGLRDALWQEERAAPGILYRRLAECDPQSARRIEPNNIVYVIRALEILAASGRPASELRRAHGFLTPRRALRLVAPMWTREALRQRIRRRIEVMLRDGLLAETEALLAGGVDATARPMRALGYRQCVDVIRGQSKGSELSDRIFTATWAYAKRQLTWLAKEKGVERLAVRHHDELGQIADQLATS